MQSKARGAPVRAALRVQFSNFNESTFIFHPRLPRGNKSDTADSGYRRPLTANVARWIAFLIIFICPITLGNTVTVLVTLGRVSL